MGIEDVADELYGLPPEEFTAARNTRAKAAKDDGDRELAAAVTALRKPTAGAWLLNQLVRQHRGEVDAVLELGIRLRAAQGTLGAADLRALDEQRRQLTRAVARQAVAIAVSAGRKVSTQVAADVEETLRSAMVDPDAGAALATGLLTDTFSSNGLEPVDVARVVALGERATGRAAPAPTRTATTSDAVAQARADAPRAPSRTPSVRSRLRRRTCATHSRSRRRPSRRRSRLVAAARRSSRSWPRSVVASRTSRSRPQRAVTPRMPLGAPRCPRPGPSVRPSSQRAERATSSRHSSTAPPRRADGMRPTRQVSSSWSQVRRCGRAVP